MEPIQALAWCSVAIAQPEFYKAWGSLRSPSLAAVPQDVRRPVRKPSRSAFIEWFPVGSKAKIVDMDVLERSSGDWLWRKTGQAKRKQLRFAGAISRITDAVFLKAIPVFTLADIPGLWPEIFLRPLDGSLGYLRCGRCRKILPRPQEKIHVKDHRARDASPTPNAPGRQRATGTRRRAKGEAGHHGRFLGGLVRSAGLPSLGKRR